MKYLLGLAFSIVIFTSCNKLNTGNTLFTSLPSSKTGIDFTNKLTEKKAFGILYYLYYYNGGGVAIGDINNDGLQDIYFSSNTKGGNKLYLNKGNLSFEDITAKAGVAGTADWSTGVTMADINGDGWLDIYVSVVSQQRGLEGHNQLFINQKNATFKEQSAEFGLNFSGYSTQSAFFDYDHDGDLDCYILNQSLQPNQNIRPAATRDMPDPLAGDRFYRNDLIVSDKSNPSERGGFIDISKEVGIHQGSLGYGLGISVADFNNDGWEDVYVGNDFHENDYYYINTPLSPKGGNNATFSTPSGVEKGSSPSGAGGRGFIDSGSKSFRHYSRFSMGNDAGDFNNDGQMDVISVDMLPDQEKILKTYGSDEQFDSYQYKIISNGFQYQYSKNCLQQNNGNGESFSEIGLMAGVSASDWSWSPLFADFDNDSNKDLFISSGIVKRPVDLDYVKYVSDLYNNNKGMDASDKYDEEALEKMPEGSSHPYFFQGNGSGGFKDVSEAWGTQNLKGFFNGAAYADLDNDGDLDVITNNIDAPATILQNNSSEKQNSLSISFEGEQMNKFGIGSKVYVFADGKMQHQHRIATHGFMSSTLTNLHFGLGDTQKIDSVLVVWSDQRYQTLKNVQPKNLIVKQKDASGVFLYQSFFGAKAPLLVDVSSKINLNWKHIERPFNDFGSQPLIPHKMSTKGPKIAVGDINNDGLDDFYVCGASAQAGALMQQLPNGQFKSINEAVFKADAANEDVDAVFFDANKDGKQDLLVVCGGNEFANGSGELHDKLYINDRKGGFVRSQNFPKISENKSCVSAEDIDKDGDFDVFIGVTSASNQYGIVANSHLLLNDGKGNFTDASQEIINLKNLGMPTSSSFADINKDGWQDLVVVGEYMPITIFQNKQGKFTKETLQNSKGLWQNITVSDVNNDGNLDFLVGNWGLNNKFCSNKDGKIKLYVKDFDNNSLTDQLLSYSINGKEYPFLAKDEIERPMPVLRKHYERYADYAGLEMKDAFYGFVEQVSPLEAERLGSVVCFGDGKGNFAIKDLPMSLQKAPIFAFQKINENQFVLGGNFFEVSPYEGRYDAQPLAMFEYRKEGINYLHQTNLYNYHQQARDIKVLRTQNNKKIYVVAFNDAPLVFLQ